MAASAAKGTFFGLFWCLVWKKHDSDFGFQSSNLGLKKIWKFRVSDNIPSWAMFKFQFRWCPFEMRHHGVTFLGQMARKGGPKRCHHGVSCRAPRNEKGQWTTTGVGTQCVWSGIEIGCHGVMVQVQVQGLVMRSCARVHLRVEGQADQSRRRTIMTWTIQALWSQDV